MSTEIITAQQYTEAQLRAASEIIKEKISIITGHQSAFEEATLEHRLVIGHELAKAKAAFGLSNEDRARLGGEAKAAMSPGDKAPANPLGFSAWLTREFTDFNRSKADLYVNAFHSLGLSTDEATPKLIREKLKKLVYHADQEGAPRPTLKSLYKLGKPAPSKAPLVIEAPKDSAQLRLEDARESFHLWKEQFEKLLRAGALDDLDRKGLEDLKEFTAGVRDRIAARLKK